MAKARAQKILKWTAIALVVIFAAMQFIRPARTNPPIDQTKTIQAHTSLTPAAAAILERSCNDCHSYQTRWPWYSNVAPISWFVINHVNDGREDLNFSEWSGYSQNEQQNYLKKMCKEVERG